MNRGRELSFLSACHVSGTETSIPLEIIVIFIVAGISLLQMRKLRFEEFVLRQGDIVSQAGFKLICNRGCLCIPLSPPTKRWDYRHVPSGPAIVLSCF